MTVFSLRYFLFVKLDFSYNMLIMSTILRENVRMKKGWIKTIAYIYTYIYIYICTYLYIYIDIYIYIIYIHI